MEYALDTFAPIRCIRVPAVTKNQPELNEMFFVLSSLYNVNNLQHCYWSFDTRPFQILPAINRFPLPARRQSMSNLQWFSIKMNKYSNNTKKIRRSWFDLIPFFIPSGQNFLSYTHLFLFRGNFHLSFHVHPKFIRHSIYQSILFAIYYVNRMKWKEEIRTLSK